MGVQDLADIIHSRIEWVDSFRLAVAGIPTSQVMDECVSEAEFQLPVEELGTSDVACMARSVIRRLGRSL